MSNTESRKEFEEWIKSEFIVSHEELLQKVGSGAYVDTMTHWYWKTWQASRAKPIVLPNVIHDMDYYVSTAIELYKEAIEEAGYRCE